MSYFDFTPVSKGVAPIRKVAGAEARLELNQQYQEQRLERQHNLSQSKFKFKLH